MQTRFTENGKARIVYDAGVIEHPGQLRFDAEYWQHQGAITGVAHGRGTVFFVRDGQQQFVIRHYRRGGMVAKLSQDRYLWCGLQRTRAWREWALLVWMRVRGLPVPQPVAIQLILHGLSYSCDIMTRRIEDSMTLAERLQQAALPAQDWQRLGELIQRFHTLGIWHADLNARNILLDSEAHFYLLDFDRGRLRKAGARWQAANLARLRRSLEKIAHQSREFYFQESDWLALSDGYRRLLSTD